MVGHDRHQLLTYLLDLPAVICRLLDHQRQEGRNHSLHIDVLTLHEHLSQQLENILDVLRGPIGEELKQLHAVLAKDIEYMLRVVPADASDHGDALEGGGPVQALDAGIQLVEKLLVELGGSRQLLKFQHGGVKLSRGCVHLAIQIIICQFKYTLFLI